MPSDFPQYYYTIYFRPASKAYTGMTKRNPLIRWRESTWFLFSPFLKKYFSPCAALLFIFLFFYFLRKLTNHSFTIVNPPLFFPILPTFFFVCAAHRLRETMSNGVIIL